MSAFYFYVFVISVLDFIQAHIELQESLAGTQKETLEGLQEATMKMMSQQTEAARYTADTARHIKEVSNHRTPLSRKWPVRLYNKS